MTSSAYSLLLASLTLAALSNACALTSKGEAMSPRYFSPEAERAPSTKSRASAAATPSNAAPLELRLGQIEAASYLEERIAYRLHQSELGYYDDRRWTEEPAAYLRRALAQELFGKREIRRVVSGAAPVLDVELTAFEEVRDPTPQVRLALNFTLRDEREATLERHLVIQRPLPTNADGDHTQAVAVALGQALSEAVSQVSDAVAEHLPPPAPAPCAAPPSPSKPERVSDSSR
jgi:cholesterol transport system auxiliary component